jgi:hypothetical protein
VIPSKIKYVVEYKAENAPHTHTSIFNECSLTARRAEIGGRDVTDLMSPSIPP